MLASLDSARRVGGWQQGQVSGGFGRWPMHGESSAVAAEPMEVWHSEISSGSTSSAWTGSPAHAGQELRAAQGPVALPDEIYPVRAIPFTRRLRRVTLWPCRKSGGTPHFSDSKRFLEAAALRTKLAPALMVGGPHVHLPLLHLALLSPSSCAHLIGMHGWHHPICAMSTRTPDR